jgi:hypothetical protein
MDNSTEKKDRHYTLMTNNPVNLDGCYTQEKILPLSIDSLVFLEGIFSFFMQFLMI